MTNDVIRDTTFWGICLGHALTHWYPATFYILLPYMTDISSRKNVLMAVSLILVGFPFLFLGIVNWYGLLMISIMVMGIGKEIWHPPSFSTLSYHYAARRGFVFGCHGMSANLGDALAPL